MADKYVTMTSKQIDTLYPIDREKFQRLTELQRQGVEPNLSDPDAPETADAPEGMFAGLARRLRGRPKKQSVLQRIDILLDPEDVSYLRATGEGWQTRLREYVKKGISSQLL